MAVTIVGAGAIGGVTGASLTRAGHDVLLVDQAADHVAAMNERGLAIVTPDGVWSVPVRAVTPDALPATLDLVLLAVKAQHTGDRARPHRAAARAERRGRVPPERAERGRDRGAGGPGAGRSAASSTGRPTGSRRVGSSTAARARSRSASWTASSRRGPRSWRTCSARSRRPRSARTSWGLKWAKHVYSALLVATALVDAHVYEVVERSPEIQRMLVALVAEGMAVAEAEGVRLEAFDEFDPAWYRAGRAGDAGAVARAMAAISKFYRGHTKTKTGIWRDLAVRKRKTEVEAHVGATLARAERHGIRIPLTRRLLALIGELETGRRAMAWENLDELVALRP